MTKEEISDAIGQADDRFLEETAARREQCRKKIRTGRVRKLAASATIVLSIAACTLFWLKSGPAQAIEPVSPEAIDKAAGNPDPDTNRGAGILQTADGEQYGYTDTGKDILTASHVTEGESADNTDAAELQPFFSETALTLLTQSDPENTVYSPVNLYLALAMAAECISGEAQEELFGLLGADSAEMLRAKTGMLWEASECSDDRMKLLPGNSLWLSQDEGFDPDMAKLLETEYHAALHQGEMGSEAFNEELRGWINEQTGKLLKEYTNQLSLSPKDVLALVSTIYFQANWISPFQKESVQRKTFHGTEGDTEVSFLTQSGGQTIYRGSDFEAVCLPFQTEYPREAAMWLILPEEGATVLQVLEGEEMYRLLEAPSEWKEQSRCLVHLSVPKFDVSCRLDLKDSFEQLGLTHFVEGADWSRLLPGKTEMTLSKAEHAARVHIDENGCEAAAYTILAVDKGMEILEEEAEFHADRPFLFVITGDRKAPLFAGVVNQLPEISEETEQ